MYNIGDDFERTLFDYYTKNKREMPWRQIEANDAIDPYKVMLSEIMLQQTQVSRVVPKFETFLQKFPTVNHLAASPLADVLRAWKGLGYNRRARFLWLSAQAITRDYGGVFPQNVKQLTQLPGIGKNTAGAIVVYAFNKPEIFIETNIRTVFIHHFFADDELVSDAQIRKLLERTLDNDNPREFYWALMDYGAHLKKTAGNASRRSKSYVKQSTFQGSLRQLRGEILRQLGSKPQTETQLMEAIGDSRIDKALSGLEKDGLISQKRRRYQLG